MHRERERWLHDHPEVEQRLIYIEQALSAEHTRDNLEHLRFIESPGHSLEL
jgi:hypothetical protein